ncbi:hypothetical protein M0804_010429 [Polistes exclamans]|nr:hypothetical protein M0804_010429 [Polistes exclamans]
MKYVTAATSIAFIIAATSIKVVGYRATTAKAVPSFCLGFEHRQHSRGFLLWEHHFITFQSPADLPSPCHL